MQTSQKIYERQLFVKLEKTHFWPIWPFLFQKPQNKTPPPPQKKIISINFKTLLLQLHAKSQKKFHVMLFQKKYEKLSSIYISDELQQSQA